MYARRPERPKNPARRRLQELSAQERTTADGPGERRRERSAAGASLVVVRVVMRTVISTAVGFGGNRENGESTENGGNPRQILDKSLTNP